MSTTSMQAAIQGMEDCRLLQIYGDSRFSTATNGEAIFLLSTVRISKYNVIATIDSDNVVTIFDRDKANSFVDWSHEHFGNKKPIDELPDSQIKEYIKNYLAPDTTSLLQFKDKEFTAEAKSIFNRFSSKAQSSIISAMTKMGVYADGKITVECMQIRSMTQFDWAHDNKFHFVKLDANTQRYDICTRTADGGYTVIAKNGNCGATKKLLNDRANRCCIVFNKSDGMSISIRDINSQILEDVKGSSYAAANKFVRVEEKLTKALDELVSILTAASGTIDMADVHYPNLDNETESIAKLVKKYQKTEDAAERLNITNELAENYSACYTKLQKAQESLRALYAKIEK